MHDGIIKFGDSDRIGRVASVDTSRVLIDAEDQRLVTQIGVGNLVAIVGSTEREYLIGIVERVTRTIKDMLMEDDTEDSEVMEIGPAPSDFIRVVLTGTYRTVQGDKKQVFKRGADSFPQIDREAFLITSNNLQKLMGLLASGLKDNEKLKLGHFVIDAEAEVIASGDKFFQRHASILGSTGSGKSWSVALLLEKASQLNYPNIIVLDMHGEYTPLSEEKGFAKGFKIAGPGDLESDNENIIRLPYWLLNRDEMLSMILDRSDQNAPNQASRFTLHIRNLKEKTLQENKKEEVKETFTVDSPIPYELNELVGLLKIDDTKKGVGKSGPVKGDWEGKLTRFISRLEAKIEDRRYGFMFKPTDCAKKYEWLARMASKLMSTNDKEKGIKLVDFSEVPSDILPVVTGTFARLLYDLQFWMESDKRSPFALVCDEAHIYLPVKNDADAVEKQALATFERIAKEGRKYGVSLVVVSQRPSDVSRTILSQCNNFLVLRLTNDADQNVVRKLIPDSMVGLTDMLPLLDTGEALLLGDAVLLPTRIKLDKPTVEPASATLNFWSDWSSKQSNNEAIQLAVETLRRQTRG